MDQLDLIKKRTSKLIIDLKNRNHLTNRKLCKLLECSRNTIDNYLHCKRMPRTEVINGLARLFGVNMDWLYHGRGKRYHGDGMGPISKKQAALPHGDRHSDRPPAPSHTPVRGEEAGPGPEDADGLPADLRLIDGMSKAARILRSETRYSFSLALLIVRFDRAHRAEKHYAKITKKIKQLEDKQDALTREIPDSE